MSRTLLRNLLVKGGNLSLALENLFGVEKITRQVTAIQRRLIYQGQDMVATKTVAIAILKLCVERGDWASINSSVTTLSKRRGQFKQVRLASLHLTSLPLLCPFPGIDCSGSNPNRARRNGTHPRRPNHRNPLGAHPHPPRRLRRKSIPPACGILTRSDSHRAGAGEADAPTG